MKIIGRRRGMELKNEKGKMKIIDEVRELC